MSSRRPGRWFKNGDSKMMDILQGDLIAVEPVFRGVITFRAGGQDSCGEGRRKGDVHFEL